MTSFIRTFGVINKGNYYADLGASVKDLFGFDLAEFDGSEKVFINDKIGSLESISDIGSGFKVPSRNCMICLKRGEDGKDCYRYSFFGFVSKSVVRVTKYKKLDFFKFPGVLSRELGIRSGDKKLYVYYADDGSIVMSKKTPKFYDYIEDVKFGGNMMFVSKSLDTYMLDSYYAVVVIDGGFILVPIGSAMWSFISYDRGCYNMLIENIYDFVVLRDGSAECVNIRFEGGCPMKFEVLNNVGH